MIRKLQAYVNDEGVKVEHIEKVNDGDSLEFSYFGVAQMVTNFGQSEVRFVIPASTLEEAFGSYEAELNKFSEEMKKQIAQRQQAAQEQAAKQEMKNAELSSAPSDTLEQTENLDKEVVSSSAD